MAEDNNEHRFLKISYTAKVKDGEVFDTTDEEVAQQEGIYNERKLYGPFPVVVGEGQVVEGLDEALADMQVGDEQELELSPEKAYGERDSNLIRLVSKSVFRQQDINPVPGMVVELDGQYAKVQTVSGGRVRVDFNHELAGKTVVFDVKVEEEASTQDERLNFLIERSFNSADDFEVELEENTAIIELPPEVYRDKNLLYRKASFAGELFKYLDLDNVKYIENWENPEAESEEESEEDSSSD